VSEHVVPVLVEFDVLVIRGYLSMELDTVVPDRFFVLT
jgi:hypothetical protein